MAVVYTSAHIEAARLASNHPIMDALAKQTMSRVVASVAPHNKSGDYMRSLKIVTDKGRSGIRDRLIVTTDPNAYSIEVGHLQGPEGDAARRWIPGTNIMAGAFGSLIGTNRRFK